MSHQIKNPEVSAIICYLYAKIIRLQTWAALMDWGAFRNSTSLSSHKKSTPWQKLQEIMLYVAVIGPQKLTLQNFKGPEKNLFHFLLIFSNKFNLPGACLHIFGFYPRCSWELEATGLTSSAAMESVTQCYSILLRNKTKNQTNLCNKVGLKMDPFANSKFNPIIRK